MADDDQTSASWRPEWKRKPRGRAKAKLAAEEATRVAARAREREAQEKRTAELLADVVPSAPELAAESVAVLRSVALNALAEDKDRVAAAKALHDIAGEDPLIVLQKLLGSVEATVGWMREHLPVLESQLAAKQLLAKGGGDGGDDGSPGRGDRGVDGDGP